MEIFILWPWILEELCLLGEEEERKIRDSVGMEILRMRLIRDKLMQSDHSKLHRLQLENNIQPL